MAKKKKTRRSSGGGGKNWLILLFCLGLISGLAWLFLRPSQVEVPDLIGSSIEAAKSQLSKRDLQVTVSEKIVEGGTVKNGEVLEQSPEAKEMVPKATVVTLVVAKVNPGIPVPGVVGLTRSQAEDKLRRLGFEVDFVETQSQTVDVGKVVSQSPKEGTVDFPKGSTVVLKISTPKSDQKVPNLAGLGMSVARDVLIKKGFKMEVLQVASDTFREGDSVTVLRQEPAAGTLLPDGSKVTVFIPVPAPRPPVTPNHINKTVHAPKVEGLTVAQARIRANEAGVALELADSASEESVITFQEPPAGDPLSGSDPAVLVRVAKSAVVPGLSGVSLSEAKKRVQAADLTVGSVKKSYGEVPNEVLGQLPSPGIEVVAGSKVDLVVSDPSLNPEAASIPEPTPTPAFSPAPWVE